MEEAVKGGGKATWGPQGYYFSSRGEEQVRDSRNQDRHRHEKLLKLTVAKAWGDVATSITRTAYELGYIASKDISEFNDEESSRSAGHSSASLIFGGNAREKSIRARKLLDWNPSRGSLFDEIPAAVKTEAERLGLKPTYNH